jgi:uncharacterized repeat protein (TIGR03803 family)
MTCRNEYRFVGTRAVVLSALWMCGSGLLLAQTFTSRYLFGSDGPPTAGLVEGTDGNLYGTTYGYSGKENGMIFRITPSGGFTTLHSGGAFAAGLILGTDGNFYGTSLGGGALGHGWVFKITPGGTLTTLHNFGPLPSGMYPTAVVQASDGNFYGTTKEGGTNSCLYGGTNFGCGTLFRITPSGTLTTLHNFCSRSVCADGQEPGGALVQGDDGNLYGTTGAGENAGCGPSGGCGTIFKITTTGTLTTLHTFDLTDGGNPARLVQAKDGDSTG